jgi:hypothetical protein
MAAPGPGSNAASPLVSDSHAPLVFESTPSRRGMSTTPRSPFKFPPASKAKRQRTVREGDTIYIDSPDGASDDCFPADLWPGPRLARQGTLFNFFGIGKSSRLDYTEGGLLPDSPVQNLVTDCDNRHQHNGDDGSTPGEGLIGIQLFWLKP